MRAQYLNERGIKASAEWVDGDEAWARDIVLAYLNAVEADERQAEIEECKARIRAGYKGREMPSKGRTPDHVRYGPYGAS